MNIPENFLPYTKFIPIIIIGFICSLLLTPIVGIIVQKYKILDLPGNLRRPDDPTRSRRIHTEPKLKLGGIAVVLPFLVIILITVPGTKFLWGFIAGLFVLFICGIIDDIYELPAKIQAGFHIIAALLVVASGLEVTVLNNPFGHAISLTYWQFTIHGIIRFLPAAIFTVVWIFFIINAVKWVAGSDGLVEGNGAIAAIIIGLLSVRFQTQETAFMGFAFAGCLLGFLVYNFYPAKIYSGSAGKSVYGFILAVLAIYSGGKLATFILTLSLPIIDAVWVIGYRIYKHKPKNIFQLFAINDKSHMHHKLLSIGFNPKQVAFIEYTYTLLTGIFAFFLTGLHKALAICIFIFFLLLLYTILALNLKNRHSQ